MGNIIATAFHDPKELKSLFRPTLKEVVNEAEDFPESWDDDEWWTGQSGSVEG